VLELKRPPTSPSEMLLKEFLKPASPASSRANAEAVEPSGY
jgi:hypothetical protein